MGLASICWKITARIAWRKTYRMLTLSTRLFSHWSIHPVTWRRPKAARLSMFTHFRGIEKSPGQASQFNICTIWAMDRPQLNFGWFWVCYAASDHMSFFKAYFSFPLSFFCLTCGYAYVFQRFLVLSPIASLSSEQTFSPVNFVLLQFSHSKKAVECFDHLRLNLFQIRVVLYQYHMLLIKSVIWGSGMCSLKENVGNIPLHSRPRKRHAPLTILS